eukprot:s7597_g2.t1
MMWAGMNFAGDGRRRRYTGYGLSRLSNKGDNEKTRLCPEGTWLKRMEVCSGNKWDGASAVIGEGRRRQTQMDKASGARRVYGAAGSNVDKLCIDGGKLGPHRRQLQAAEGLEIFMALHVVSPDDEYDRRRSIRFLCNEVRPVVKAFDCTDAGCRAMCANDNCKIKPFCVKAHVNIVESGTEATSTGGGAWSGWSTCPHRYSAAGLRYMELIGSVVDADVSSLDGLECIDNKCFLDLRKQRHAT